MEHLEPQPAASAPVTAEIPEGVQMLDGEAWLVGFQGAVFLTQFLAKQCRSAAAKVVDYRNQAPQHQFCATCARTARVGAACKFSARAVKQKGTVKTPHLASRA